MTSPKAFPPYLRAALEGPLDESQAAEAFSLIVAGKVDPVPMAAFLAAIQARGAHEDEILAIARILLAKTRRFPAPAGAVDTCGTGGDGSGSFNISTAAALVLAGCGVPVVKHGNRAQSSRSGSADVLEALGVDLNADEAALRRCLDQARIVFLMAPRHHPVMKAVLPVRQAMKVRTVFNLIGPLVNPARPKRQIVGVYHRRWLEPIARVLGRLGGERVWVVHGQGGMDEITLGPTSAVEWRDGALRSFTIHPDQAGLAPAPMTELSGSDPAANAEMMRRLLNNAGDVPAPLRDVVILNAAAALCVCERAENLEKGAAQARQALESGAARQALERLAAISTGSS